MGGGGVIMGAVSAIDIALWDIKGKALGGALLPAAGGQDQQPPAGLRQPDPVRLGRESRSLVRPEEYAEAARKAVAEGYDAVKVDRWD